MRARWIGALLLALCLTGCGWMEGYLMEPKDLHQVAKVLEHLSFQ